MTADFAVEYIRYRMNELGFGGQYSLRFRHFRVSPKGTIKIETSNQFFILIEPNDGIVVESAFGVFDLTRDAINELQYEHSGDISISNYTTQSQHARFIQVIPNDNATVSKKL